MIDDLNQVEIRKCGPTPQEKTIAQQAVWQESTLVRTANYVNHIQVLELIFSINS